MVRIGYHASHEQFAPGELLRYAQAAEAAGFDAVMSSDHLAPWSLRQGHSGHMWTWVAAAMQATRLPFGFITVPGGWRYHPVLVAQAAATLEQLFPGRIPWLAVGSGEALNECAVGGGWPDKEERNERLRAGASIVRRLWSGEAVSETHPIPVSEARLYTRPEAAPRLIAGVLTPATAEWSGQWADGLITISQATEKLRDIVDAFRRGGGTGKPILLQVHVSIARDDETARANAFDQWRSNAVDADLAASLRTPEEFDAAARDVRPEDMDRHVLISADPARHRAWLAEFAAMGFEEIYVHNVGRNQREFIDIYGEHVLPVLKERAA